MTVAEMREALDDVGCFRDGRDVMVTVLRASGGGKPMGDTAVAQVILRDSQLRIVTEEPLCSVGSSGMGKVPKLVGNILAYAIVFGLLGAMACASLGVLRFVFLNAWK